MSLSRKRFFCQECRTIIYTENNVMPAGWFSMIRSNGEYGEYRRLGLFCSLDCLIARVPRLRMEIGEEEAVPA